MNVVVYILKVFVHFVVWQSGISSISCKVEWWTFRLPYHWDDSHWRCIEVNWTQHCAHHQFMFNSSQVNHLLCVKHFPIFCVSRSACEKAYMDVCLCIQSLLLCRYRRTTGRWCYLCSHCHSHCVCVVQHAHSKAHCVTDKIFPCDFVMWSKRKNVTIPKRRMLMRFTVTPLLNVFLSLLSLTLYVCARM